MEHEIMKSSRETICSLREQEWKYTSSDESRIQYFKDHKERFEKTISICKKLVPNRKSKILDVGRSYFTKLLSDEYENVWSIGFGNLVDIGGHRSIELDECRIKHIEFDLNESKDLDRWPNVEKSYDLIIYAETIEHLAIAPEYSILFLSNLLAPEGILLLTTPNAVTISKRLKLLFGRNPFEKIRLLSQNPGHYREYTLKELREIGTRCKLKVKNQKHVNFYNNNKILKVIFKNLLPSFRDSILIVYER